MRELGLTFPWWGFTPSSEAVGSYKLGHSELSSASEVGSRSNLNLNLNLNHAHGMFFNLNKIIGHPLAATDGGIGQIKDFYFDASSWTVRYLVVETGDWFSGRPVLLSPYAFRHFEPASRMLRLNLTRAQIEESPAVDLRQPVSRQFEEKYNQHYGWPSYWPGERSWGLTVFPVVQPTSPPGSQSPQYQAPTDELRLRSTQTVTGYEIQAVDGATGTVSGFITDDLNWTIRSLLVDAGHWFEGQEVLIPTGKIGHICTQESLVHVNLTKDELRHSDSHPVAQACA